MIFLKKVAILISAVLCSGCVMFDSNIENLISPPSLTDLQHQVDSSLRAVVGDDIKLKYPQNGDYKSAYNFIDLDGDGVDEAVALFSSANEDIIKIAVLTQKNDIWSVTDVLPGENYYTTADFLSYQTIGSKKYLTVGWTSNSISSHNLIIYTYDKDSTNNYSLNIESKWNYNKLMFADFDEDGVEEVMILVLADNYNTTEPYVLILDEVEDGLLHSTAMIHLAKNIVDFKNVSIGMIDQEQFGLYIDCMLTNDYMSTVAITYINGQLFLPFEYSSGGDVFDEYDDSIYRTTFRQNYVYSGDVNGDGILDVPVEEFASGYESRDISPVYFTNYCSFLDGELVPFQKSYVNLSKNYRFDFPASWDRLPVSANVQADNSDVVFFIAVNGDIHDFSSELVRVSAYSVVDGTDKIDTTRYFELDKKGTIQYAASLPINQTETATMTIDIVKNCFVLLD